LTGAGPVINVGRGATVGAVVAVAAGVLVDTGVDVEPPLKPTASATLRALTSSTAGNNTRATARAILRPCKATSKSGNR